MLRQALLVVGVIVSTIVGFSSAFTPNLHTVLRPCRSRLSQLPGLCMSSRMDSHANRRSAIGSFLLVGVSSMLLPGKAFSEGPPLSASEAEEYARLLKEANRIKGLFDDMKSANSDLETAKVSSKNSKTPSSSLMNPEQVATKIFAALRNNNSPAPNNGLKVALDLSSPFNPVKKQPFEYFTQIMEGGKYSILLGQFEDFNVASTELAPAMGGEDQICYVDVKVKAKPEIFFRSRMPEEYLEEADGGRRAATFRLQLRKGEETTKGEWLSDALYLLTPAPMA